MQKENLADLILVNDEKLKTLFKQYDPEVFNSLNPPVIKSLEDFLDEYANYEGMKLIFDECKKDGSGFENVITSLCTCYSYIKRKMLGEEKYNQSISKILRKYLENTHGFVIPISRSETNIYLNPNQEAVNKGEIARLYDQENSRLTNLLIKLGILNKEDIELKKEMTATLMDFMIECAEERKPSRISTILHERSHHYLIRLLESRKVSQYLKRTCVLIEGLSEYLPLDFLDTEGLEETDKKRYCDFKEDDVTNGLNWVWARITWQAGLTKNDLDNLLRAKSEQEFLQSLSKNQRKKLEKYTSNQVRRKGKFCAKKDLYALGFTFSKAITEEFGVFEMFDLLCSREPREDVRISDLELLIPKFYIQRKRAKKNMEHI